MIVIVNTSTLACAQDIPRVQCFDGCSASPALLGTFPTIGECCGFEGLQGGGFLLAEDPDTCINCTNFRSNLFTVIMTVCAIDSSYNQSLYKLTLGN